MAEAINMPPANSSLFRVIQHMIKHLFEAEHRRLDRGIAKLIERNNEIKSVSFAGYLYYGEYYTAKGFNLSQGTTKIILDDSLNEEMEWHLKDATMVKMDEQLISQMIFKLTRDCGTLQELRDTLPDCLGELIPALKLFDRHDEQGCSLKQDVRGSRQFLDILPKIEMYSAARLLY